jgi:hypothetical protein
VIAACFKVLRSTAHIDVANAKRIDQTRSCGGVDLVGWNDPGIGMSHKRFTARCPMV